MTFPSSNELRYPCLECGKGLSDPAARIRHRKKAHGYKPYHTARYVAKQAIKKAEQESGKALSSTTRDQLPHDPSSSAATLSNILTNAPYHDNFWKQIIDVPRRHSSELKESQDVQIGVPVSAAPACDAPNTLHSDSDLSSPFVFPTSDAQLSYPGMDFQTLLPFSGNQFVFPGGVRF